MQLRSIHRCQLHPNPSISQPSIFPHRHSSPATHRPNLHSVPLTEHFYHSPPPITSPEPISRTQIQHPPTRPSTPLRRSPDHSPIRNFDTPHPFPTHPIPPHSQPSTLSHQPVSPATHRPNLHSVPLTEHFYHSPPPSRQPRTDLPDSDSTPPHPTLHTTPTLTRPQPHPQLRHAHPFPTHPIPPHSQPSTLSHQPVSPATHRPNLHSVPLTEHFYHPPPPNRQPRTDLPDSESTPPHPTLHTTPTLTRPQPHPQLRHAHPFPTHPIPPHSQPSTLPHQPISPATHRPNLHSVPQTGHFYTTLPSKLQTHHVLLSLSQRSSAAHPF